MILSLCDNTATKNFLFMDNSREEKLTEFLANNKKLAKNQVIIVSGTKSRDSFFVDRISPVETDIYMKLKEANNA